MADGFSSRVLWGTLIEVGMSASIPETVPCDTCGAALSHYAELSGGGTTTRYFRCSKCDKVSTIERTTDPVIERRELDDALGRLESLDNWILTRYWKPAITQSVLARRALWSEYCDKRNYKAIETECDRLMAEAFDPADMADFCFDVECARAFYSSFYTPTSVSWPQSILHGACERVWTTGHSPCARATPPYIPDDDTLARLQDEERQWNESYPRGWNPPKTPHEAAVDACLHSALATTRTSDGFKTENFLQFRPGLEGCWGYGTGVITPYCRTCKASILCACVADVFVRHVGASHAVLADFRYKQRTVKQADVRLTGTGRQFARSGRGCVGFLPGLCELCVSKRRSTPEDADFRNGYAWLHAIRLCMEEEPLLYKAMFPISTQDERPSTGPAIMARLFPRIARGENTRMLREQFKQQTVSPQQESEADLPLFESFRPYWNRARSLFRAAYGLPAIGEGWVSEGVLLQIVQELFPGERVLTHVRPPWLKGLELDIYLPDRSLAFEYMGRQHYEPVEFFGGTEAFYQVVERDCRKRQICLERGIRLVDVRYDEPLTSAAIKTKCGTAIKEP